MNRFYSLLLFFGITLVNLGYSLSKVAGLPNTVAVHWGLSGKPDRYGSKYELALGLPVVTLVLGLVFVAVFTFGRIPKGSRSEKALNIVLISLAGFMFAMQMVILDQSPETIKTFFPILMSLLLIVLGFSMKGIEPNPWAGIRVPWTMNSERVWRRTHDRASKLWIVSGVIGVLVSPFVPFWLPLTLFILVTLIPVLDSWCISRQIV